MAQWQGLLFGHRRHRVRGALSTLHGPEVLVALVIPSGPVVVPIPRTASPESAMGAPTRVKRLARFPWKQIYELQSLLQSTKTLFGSFSRILLPGRVFLRPRWLVFGKGRY